MIVMKFGGTSVQDAAAMGRLAAIVADRRAERPVVVVSALAGATDQLIELATLALHSEGFAAGALAALRERHLRVLGELPGGAAALAERGEVEAAFAALGELLRGISAVGELTPRTRDAVVSYGERLSPLLVRHALATAGLPAVAADARRVVITDERFTAAQPIAAEVQRAAAAELQPLLAAGSIPVLGGFIGATRRGIGTTLGRGGSDFSAAILGAALGAERIEIWTDVDGMLTADPRLCPGARRIPRISFAEAAESAYFGAKVLHPSTLLPAMRKNIPVWVLNSRDFHPGPPDAAVTGTLITAQAGGQQAAPSAPAAGSAAGKVACISSKRGVAVVDVVSTRMLMAHGFLKAIFDVFAAHQCQIDMISTSEVSVSLTVADTAPLPAIADALGRFAEVRYEGRKAIVCLVGGGMRNTPGVAAAVFAALGDINIRMISQGASEMNISLVIEDDDVPRAVERLHAHFFPAAAAVG
ncbi:MAG: lysine-sensitive aspartokinase 3 [Terriglobales bacterium]